MPYVSCITTAISSKLYWKTVTITQFKRRISHVPNLIREVTVWHVTSESTVSNYSETLIKWTPSIKRTVAEVLKFISLIYFKWNLH